jgi:hypothetical protein
MAELKLVCPITGAAVQIIEVKCGDFSSPGYLGRVESEFGGYSTNIFQHKTQLQDFFRRRNGALKGAPLYNPPKIEVIEPIDREIKAIEESERQEERDQNEMAKAGANDILRRVVRNAK